MNYRKAVKGFHTKLLPSIHSAAEIELGRKLTKEEVNTLITKFSLEDANANVEKVCFFQRLKM